MEIVFRALRNEVFEVRPFRTPWALDLRRGYEIDTRAKQNAYGDCRSQRINFFRKYFPPSDPRARSEAFELDQVVVTNRYRRPQWLQSKAPRDCGDPSQNVWIVAKDDYTFFMSADALGRVATEAFREGASANNFNFRLTCSEFGQTCADPNARLQQAFALNDLEVSVDGSAVVLAGDDRGLKMSITGFPDGRPQAVSLEYVVPPIS
jgi:hypothetical protein